MGRIISDKIRGMNGMAKVSLVLIFTMVFGLYLFTDVISIREAEASDPASLIHNSVTTGLCSDTAFTTKAACETGGKIWTPSARWGTNGWGISGGKYGEFACETCHTRTTANIKRVKETITAPNSPTDNFPGGSVIFNSAKSGSSDFGDDSNQHATSTKVCEVCHTYSGTQVGGVKFHAYDMSGGGKDLTHYNKTDCIACHTHNRGFKPTDCDGCHGNPPTSDLLNAASPGGNTGLADSPYVTGSEYAGAHDRHVNQLGYDNCLICHNNYSMPSTAGTYTIDIKFNFGGSTTGSYDGQTAARYSADNTNTGTMTCSTVYCHSSGQGSGADNATPVYATPAWTGSVSCGDCHATTTMATGSHTKHLAADTDCGLCHTGATATTYSSADHVNRLIEVANSYTAGGAPGNGYGTCSTASCHASPVAAGTVVTPVWGATGTGCAACHTGANTILATGPATGGHAGHAETDCTKCHNAGTTATSKPSTEHADGLIDTANVGYTDEKAKGSAYATCSTAACHANVYGSGTVVTPVWGAAAGCSACHSIAIGVNGPATGGHATHAGSLCTSCHNAGTTATIKPNTAHADGDIDVVGVGYQANVAKHAAGSGYSSCSAAVCHSNVYGSGSAVTPVWGAASTGCSACHSIPIGVNGPATGGHTAHAGAACTQCHNAGTTATLKPSTAHADGDIDVVGVGYQANVAKHAAGSGYGSCSTAACHDAYGTSGVATPVWGASSTCGSCHTIAGDGAPSTGSHATHMSKSLLCGDCHSGAVKDTAGGAGHLDSDIDVSVGSYPTNIVKHAAGSGYSSCSTAACHSDGRGNYATVTWGTNLGADCTGCHAFAPDTGAHAAHVQDASLLTKAYGSTEVVSDAGNYAFGCGNCHPANAASHGNGTVELSLNPADGGPLKSKNSTSVDITGSGGTTACNLTYCHSDGSKTGDLIVAGASPQWGGAFAGDKCANCHGNSPSTAAHGMHVVGIHYYNIYTGTTGLATAGNTLAGSHGNAEGSTTINCNVCHNSTVTSAANDRNTICVTCHTGGNLMGNAAIASKAFHINGTADIAFADMDIRTKAQLRDDITTVAELNNNWIRNSNSYKTGSTPYDISADSLQVDAVWNAGGKTCSNISCHNGNQATWNSSPISCSSCHTSLTN